MNVNFIKPVISMLRVMLLRKHKLRLIALLFMTILLSIIETFGISIIMPFISVASEPDILDRGRYNAVFKFLGFTSKDDFILCFGLGIIVFYILRAAYNVFYTYIQNRFALGTFRYLADNLYEKYLLMPYKIYLQKNTSEFHNGIGQAQNVSLMLLCIMQICSDSITILMLYSFMLIVNWGMTLILTAILALLVVVIIKVIIKNSKRQGVKAAEGNADINRIQNESYSNFKFVRIKGVEDYYMGQFDKATLTVSKAQVVSTTLGAMPRNLLESTGFSLIVGAVLLILFRYGSAESIIPVIAMYALALYRILPSINRMLSNVNQAAYLQHSLNIVHEHFTQETVHEGGGDVTFNNSITFNDVSFQYESGSVVLHDISFTINKGDKIAVTGPSGGGKSTLADLLTGIHKPISGSILVDGVELNDGNIRAWRKKIGYIPQNIYLFDGSAGDNVVFGSEYDEKRLIRALETANIWNFLRQKDGLDTRMGEGGIQLSGGQKQRIGIARALYNDPDILVLDEATSALDNETETKIMDEIYSVSKNKTLIVIAHRLTTIEKCRRRICIENGRIVNIDGVKNNAEKSS
ncbi:MAG: ATP-binding cassette domain-containing protein [Spirochaetaceae bacterium]|jgi:ATP-binding cassette subfamily B protein/ATP-binding cassette subfamily C protein|nr:ATP-binding cassette domain-containing protein [Spirochaetaceae bacterium]